MYKNVIISVYDDYMSSYQQQILTVQKQCYSNIAVLILKFLDLNYNQPVSLPPLTLTTGALLLISVNKSTVCLT